LLTLLGLVLLRDGIFAPAGATGWPGNQQSWLTTATTAADGLARATWMVPVGAVIALMGLYLLGVALRRRTRKTLALTGASGAYLLPTDVARRAASAADDVDGVLHSSATATRRRVDVKVTTTGGKGASAAVSQKVTAVVGESLQALTSAPRIRVTTSTTGSNDSKDLS
jgi:phage tail sheath gpL-like